MRLAQTILARKVSRISVWPLATLAKIGQWAVMQWKLVILLISAAVAVIWLSCRPTTWRRTVRKEFLYQCHQAGTRALPFILVTGVLVGVGLIVQALYWLGTFGQSAIIGRFLVLVLIREIAPVAVGLIVIVRSGSVIMTELATMRVDGQVRMLDAQGIDPFLYLVLPRVLAISVSIFCLTLAFLVAALGAGFMAGGLLGVYSSNTIFEFAKALLAAMGPKEFAMMPLKTFAIGFMVALIACLTGLEATGSSTDISVVLPRGLVTAVLATLVVSGMVTLLFYLG